ncbi:MAG: ribonuclease [Pseudonocardiales bacterium]|nr:ribonuclease [Jatrophihabitantaceae bacterium]MCW2604734.1 ribonuclease [Pseudonocardiales bacterium]
MSHASTTSQGHGDRAARLRWRRPVGAPAGVDFDGIRSEFAVPGAFPPAALAEAAAASALRFGALADLTALPFATVDPEGSRDLDQAMHIARDGSGFIVHYAIADVAAFVPPGGALDQAAHQRVETYYLPDRRSPLHPPSLSEGAASLLEGQASPAVVWQIALDERGEAHDVDVRRGLVASRRQWDYPTLQRALDAGGDAGGLTLLGEVGALRQSLARARGAIELDLPEQVVDPAADGRWALALRRDLPCEGWNAQISLLTGMAAAGLMLRAGIGILRTLPPADDRTIAQLRRFAHALRVDWPTEQPAGEMLTGLDRTNPVHVALIDEAATLLRGAGYTVLSGPVDPADPKLHHAGVAAPYAHVTAPLRRLVDRYGSEVCLAIASSRPVPGWALDALPVLPGEMAGGDRRARAVDKAVIDATEAWLLHDRIGETFDAAVIEASADGRSGEIALSDPPVRARCSGAGLAPGRTLAVRLIDADIRARTVRFEAV